MRIGLSTPITQAGAVKVRLLHEDSKLPYKASKDAVGHDMFAYLSGGEIIIPPGETALVGTGVAVTPPEGFWCALFARSGLAAKKGLRLANSVGVVDPDYTGEIIAAIHNDSAEPQTIQHGERIVQMAVLPYLNAEMVRVDELDDTERGSGGFGSTGK